MVIFSLLVRSRFSTSHNIRKESHVRGIKSDKRRSVLKVRNTANKITILQIGEEEYICSGWEEELTGSEWLAEEESGEAGEEAAGFWET